MRSHERDGSDDSFASAGTIKLRTARGVLLGIAAAGISAPFAFGIVVLLSHVSAEAVGYYGLLTIVLGMSGLIAAGGPAVAARFGPGVGPLPNAVTYLQSVLAPIFAGGIGAIVAALVPLPGALSPLYVAVLLSLGVIWLARQGELNAGLRFGDTQIVQAIPTLFQFVVLGLAFVVVPSVLKASNREIVFGTYAVPLGLIATWHVMHLWRKRHRDDRIFTMPPGIWRYIVGMEGVLVLSTIFISAERYVALATGNGLKTLGIYVAIYQLAELIRRIPNLVASALVPAFSLLETTGGAEEYHDSSAGPVALLGFLLGTTISMLAPWLIGLYGSEIHKGSLALSVLALAFGATAVASLDMAYAQAKDRLRLYNAGLLLGLVMFLPLTVIVASVTAFALARAGAVSVQQLVLVSRLPHVRVARLEHMCLTLLIGGAELALRMVGGDIATLAPLWWLVGIVIYWKLLGHPQPRVLVARIILAARGHVTSNMT